MNLQPLNGRHFVTAAGDRLENTDAPAGLIASGLPGKHPGGMLRCLCVRMDYQPAVRKRGPQNLPAATGAKTRGGKARQPITL